MRFWEKVPGACYYRINTSGVHSSHSNMIATTAINNWIIQHIGSSYIQKIYHWSSSYAFNSTSEQHYPYCNLTREDAIARGGEVYLTWSNTQRMVKFHQILADYYHSWISYRVCSYETYQELLIQYGLAQRLVRAIIMENQNCWLTLNVDEKDVRWVKCKVGTILEQHHLSVGYGEPVGNPCYSSSDITYHYRTTPTYYKDNNKHDNKISIKRMKYHSRHR